MVEKPKLTLELMDDRCSENCLAALDPNTERPYLVKVSLNRAARDRLAMRTGRAPPEQIVCTNTSCGGLMKALGALAPLQELVK